MKSARPLSDLMAAEIAEPNGAYLLRLYFESDDESVRKVFIYSLCVRDIYNMRIILCVLLWLIFDVYVCVYLTTVVAYMMFLLCTHVTW